MWALHDVDIFLLNVQMPHFCKLYVFLIDNWCWFNRSYIRVLSRSTMRAGSMVLTKMIRDHLGNSVSMSLLHFSFYLPGIPSPLICAVCAVGPMWFVILRKKIWTHSCILFIYLTVRSHLTWNCFASAPLHV